MPKRVVKNVARAETAREKLSGLTEKADASQEVADRDRQRKFAGMLRAFDAGLTYEEIAEITGLSKIRVSQVLAEQREKKQADEKPVKASKAPAKKVPAKKAPAAKKVAARKRAA